MTDEDINHLKWRLRNCNPEEFYEIFEQVWALVSHGIPKSAEFEKLIMAQAYESAAVWLVYVAFGAEPFGHSMAVNFDQGRLVTVATLEDLTRQRYFRVDDCPTPALCLAACVLAYCEEYKR